MSEIFESNSFRNLLTFGKEESFSLQQVQPLVNRSESFFSSSSKSHSLSSDQLNGDDLSWLMDIWNDTMPQKKNSFRPDRSISLTECSNVSFGKTKTPEVSPPPGFPPLSATSLPSSRYKTELCRSFQENGSCKYGSKCQFAHGETELRGLHRHPKYKTEPCRTFYNFGYCPYGIRCHFIHEEKPSPLTLQHQSQTPGPRLLRQSVSFAGFLGSRSSPPLTVQDPLGFTRAPSVSPPPAELSPVFSETKLMKDIQFQFCQNRSSLCDVHSIPHIAKSPKTTGCVCGHTNDFPSTVNKPFVKQDDNVPQPNLQRFSSEDSLSDRDSYSSTSSSSGSESPTFDSLGVKRLNVFERLSLSD